MSEIESSKPNNILQKIQKNWLPIASGLVVSAGITLVGSWLNSSDTVPFELALKADLYRGRMELHEQELPQLSSEYALLFGALPEDVVQDLSEQYRKEAEAEDDFRVKNFRDRILLEYLKMHSDVTLSEHDSEILEDELKTKLIRQEFNKLRFVSSEIEGDTTDYLDLAPKALRHLHNKLSHKEQPESNSLLVIVTYESPYGEVPESLNLAAEVITPAGFPTGIPNWPSDFYDAEQRAYLAKFMRTTMPISVIFNTPDQGPITEQTRLNLRKFAGPFSQALEETMDLSVRYDWDNRRLQSGWSYFRQTRQLHDLNQEYLEELMLINLGQVRPYSVGVEANIPESFIDGVKPALEKFKEMGLDIESLVTFKAHDEYPSEISGALVYPEKVIPFIAKVIEDNPDISLAQLNKVLTGLFAVELSARNDSFSKSETPVFTKQRVTSEELENRLRQEFPDKIVVIVPYYEGKTYAQYVKLVFIAPKP